MALATDWRRENWLAGALRQRKLGFPRFQGQLLRQSAAYLLLDANLSSPAGNGKEVTNPELKI